MQEKRRQWSECVSKISPDKFVFLDESGVNTDMTRRYGRSVGKKRVVDNAPLNKPKVTTILSSIRLDGTTAFTDFRGSTTGERFIAYLKDVLIPTLKPGDYVVMDNLGVHHVRGIAEIIRSVGAIPLYLPPYSPDLNPIEKLWSKIKAILRKWRIRSTNSLERAITDAFSLVCPDDCLGWFASAGYCC